MQSPAEATLDPAALPPTPAREAQGEYRSQALASPRSPRPVSPGPALFPRPVHRRERPGQGTAWNLPPDREKGRRRAEPRVEVPAHAEAPVEPQDWAVVLPHRFRSL